jgi:hypothetical protein
MTERKSRPMTATRDVNRIATIGAANYPARSIKTRNARAPLHHRVGARRAAADQ